MTTSMPLGVEGVERLGPFDGARVASRSGAVSCSPKGVELRVLEELLVEESGRYSNRRELSRRLRAEVAAHAEEVAETTTRAVRDWAPWRSRGDGRSRRCLPTPSGRRRWVRPTTKKSCSN
jgi:hypothetical protein